MKIHSQQQTSIDLGLAVIEAVIKKNNLTNVQFSVTDLADICDCSRQRIDQIERKARKKVSERISIEWIR